MPTSRLIEDLPVMVVLLMGFEVIERLKNELEPVLLIELPNSLDPNGEPVSGLDIVLLLNAFFKTERVKILVKILIQKIRKKHLPLIESSFLEGKNRLT